MLIDAAQAIHRDVMNQSNALPESRLNNSVSAAGVW